MRFLCPTPDSCPHCCHSRPVASYHLDCEATMNSTTTYVNCSTPKAIDWRHFDLATTKDSGAMTLSASYCARRTLVMWTQRLIRESMTLAAAAMTFDLAACDDARPSFDVLPSMDHLDCVVVMINAYFAAALRPCFVVKCVNWMRSRGATSPGWTLPYLMEPNLVAALNSSGKRFADATESLIAMIEK